MSTSLVEFIRQQTLRSQFFIGDTAVVSRSSRDKLLNKFSEDKNETMPEQTSDAKFDHLSLIKLIRLDEK